MNNILCIKVIQGNCIVSSINFLLDLIYMCVCVMIVLQFYLV